MDVILVISTWHEDENFYKDFRLIYLKFCDSVVYKCTVILSHWVTLTFNLAFR